MAVTFILLLTSVVVGLLLSMLDGPATFLAQLRGQPRIYIRSISGTVKGEIWVSNYRRDPWGDAIAYRYPGTKIGRVSLNDDGTGYYFGTIEWKFARSRRGQPA